MSTEVQAASGPELLRVEKAVYGGDGLARRANGEVVMLPFTLPGEVVETGGSAGLRVLEASPERVEARCVHFGTCGGCQYQMASYPEQVRLKVAILRETLERGGVSAVPEIRALPSPEPWGYRNRIRLRVRVVDGIVRLGYSMRGSKEFLAVRMCPIAAPVLWATTEALMQAAAGLRDAAEGLESAAEVELACDGEGTRAQVHLLCPGAAPSRKGGLETLARSLEIAGLPVVSIAASRLHVASGRALELLASWGAEGLAYRVGAGSFYLKRGSFFQVNRFLVPEMVATVCREHRGRLAWDLFAGVGLFARSLAERFEQVTGVEANPVAVEELRRGLRRPGDQAVGETTLAFLRKAVVQRERPELIVLDPPRAGAGQEACELLARLAPKEIVYVSCDPTTLARDLGVLLAAGFSVAELHMIDLFPQTYHLETVISLRHRGMGG